MKSSDLSLDVLLLLLELLSDLTLNKLLSSETLILALVDVHTSRGFFDISASGGFTILAQGLFFDSDLTFGFAVGLGFGGRGSCGLGLLLARRCIFRRGVGGVGAGADGGGGSSGSLLGFGWGLGGGTLLGGLGSRSGIYVRASDGRVAGMGK